MQQVRDGDRFVFIVHHGKHNGQLNGLDCSKRIAEDIKARLQQHPHPVPTFVDETDLRMGADAPRCLTQRLLDCQVAVVLFCEDFFSSPCCSHEAKLIAQHARHGRFVHLPVFFFATVDEVKEAATKAWSGWLGWLWKGREVADLVETLVTRTGVRHKHELCDGVQVTKAVTINKICEEVRKLCPPAVAVQAPPAAAAGMGRAASPATSHLVPDAGQAPSFVITINGSLLLEQPALALVAANMAAVLGHAQIAVVQGCVTAVADLPAHSSCSPQELLSWAQQLSHKLTAAEPALGWPTVVAASGAGGLVAWCQQGWGACLAPSAAGLPSLLMIRGRVLPGRRRCFGSWGAGIIWQGVEGSNPTLLAKQGHELHAKQLRSTAAACPDVSSALADILAEMFPDEGWLLLSASTGQYLSSTPEEVLVLDVDAETAAHLSMMEVLAGSLVLHWLDTLLLQPDSQLSLLQTADSSSSSSGAEGSSSSSSSIASTLLAARPGEFDAGLLQRLEQQLLQQGSDLSHILCADLKLWLPADAPTEAGAPVEPKPQQAGSAAAAAVSIRLAAVRARAAYALLAVAIRQKRLPVVRWLLARLSQQRQWLAKGHCTAEAVLVAQQRVAWSGVLPGFQLPLLVLADAVGGATMTQELIEWTTHHGLPTSPSTPALSAAWQEQTSLVAGWGPMGLGCLDGALPPALSDDEWLAVAAAPFMLQGASVEELASVLGPEGDLSVAVLGGSLECVQGVLDSGGVDQPQLDEALEIAAMLGSSRLQLLQLLLEHGADPTSRGAAALVWAEQRQGEPQVLAALRNHPAARPPRSTTSSSRGLGNLAVAAWCMGLHHELSGLRKPGALQPQLQSLKQFLTEAAAPGQRTVANLLAQLRQEWPELWTPERASHSGRVIDFHQEQPPFMEAHPLTIDVHPTAQVAVPPTLSLPEIEDAVKYAKVASLAYVKDKAAVLGKLQEFETRPGFKPFAGLTEADVDISYDTTMSALKLLPGSLKPIEVMFIRVRGKDFDQDHLKAPGDQLIVAFSASCTTYTLTEVLGSEIATSFMLSSSIASIKSSIKAMKGLPQGTLHEPKYDRMLVHRGFLAAFNTLVTGGGRMPPLMEATARRLLGGHLPARVVCCGHGLGAALATLGAFWWSKRHPKVEIFHYAFASPRVGNEAFKEEFGAGGKKVNTIAINRVDKSYRFTHKADLVPATPPPLLGYHHVGQAVFLIEPEENGWGLVKPGDVLLAPGQTYAALLASRPPNFLLTRIFKPVSSTQLNHHSIFQMLAGLQNILVSTDVADITTAGLAPTTTRTI